MRRTDAKRELSFMECFEVFDIENTPGRSHSRVCQSIQFYDNGKQTPWNNQYIRLSLPVFLPALLKCLMMLIVFEAYEDQTSPACGTHFSLRCAGIQSSPRGKGKTSLLSNKHCERANAERGWREKGGEIAAIMSNYLFILGKMKIQFYVLELNIKNIKIIENNLQFM